MRAACSTIDGSGNTMKRSLFDMPAGPSLAILAIAACSAASHARDGGPHAHTEEETNTRGADVARGMDVTAASETALGDPFILDAVLHVRRLENGVAVSRGALHDGDTVLSGDRV